MAGDFQPFLPLMGKIIYNIQGNFMQPLTLPKLSHPLVVDATQSLLRNISYLSPDNQQKVLDACVFGDIAHIKDKRKSGEPYITHPIAVAEILAGFRLNVDVIISAILHDTVEDTTVTEAQITQTFGEKVAQLVDGVTKLKSDKNKDKNLTKAGTFHKIFTATLEDPQVLIVKLADRLHNMSTMDAVRPEKQRSTAQETLDFYVPFARILGLNDIADYIEILCYRNLNPEMYNKLSDKLLQHGLGRNFQIENIHSYLTIVLNRLNIHGQVRNLDNKVALYRQFFKNRGDYTTLLHQYTFMMVVESVEDCDTLADYLIKKYNIPTSAIEDHIRKPLAGGNQSLKLTYHREFDSIEVVILTKRMLDASRLGVLVSDHSSAMSRSVIQASLRNLQSLLSEKDNLQDDALETVNKLMDYLHERKIVCYTPNGDAHELPRGATALDFAYAVSTGLGNTATGANINHEKAKLGSILKSGQTVEIEADPNTQPKAEWLGFVATNKARRALLQWLKGLSDSEREQHGEEAFARALKNQGRNTDELTDAEWQHLLDWRGVSEPKELFKQITTGTLLPQIMVSRLFSPQQLAQTQQVAHNSHQPQSLIADASGVEVDYAGCCHPIYGDKIVGHLSKNGLVIHRHKCFSVDDIRKDNPYQVIPLNWRVFANHEQQKNFFFDVVLKVYLPMNDEQISQAIFEVRESGAGLEKVKTLHSYSLLYLVIQNREQLSQIIHRLRNTLGYPNIQRLYQWSEEF